MRKRILSSLLLALLVVCNSIAQERERANIPEQYKWDLTHLFESETAWRQAKDKAAAEIPQIVEYRGKLMSSASGLADALDKFFLLEKDFARVASYADRLGDQDLQDGHHQGMRQEISQLRSEFYAQSAYMSSEIVAVRKEGIEAFLRSEPRLAIYRPYLEDLVRLEAHTLSENEETILAQASQLAGTPSSAYSILTNADFPYPTVTLSNGRSAKLDQATYGDLRALPNRADREKVMSAFFQSMGGFSRTFGATMNGALQRQLFFTKTRKYPSPLEMSLMESNIPTGVYNRLVEGVNRNLDTFHRYLRLRKRMLDVDELHYYDLYAPLVGSVDLEYTPEEARDLVIEALAPLGADYTAVVRRAFTERWIDLMPNTGKRSGAYATGSAYDVHPYMLMSFNGKWIDVETLAHELGHVMHSYLSNKTQPYPMAGYHTFVAEVASTFNESLLLDHVLKKVTDTDTRLALLGNYLEGIKSTVFRQTQFAEFEQRLHETTHKGQPVVGDSIARLYLEITKKYYGHDAGISVVDDYIAHEWSFVPHFYSPFYVYQYATSQTASEALASKVKAGDSAAIARYLAFLGSGGSKYPIDLLKDAGVDMTTDEPLDLTIREMNRVMDEMERLLAGR